MQQGSPVVPRSPNDLSMLNGLPFDVDAVQPHTIGQ